MRTRATHLLLVFLGVLGLVLTGIALWLNGQNSKRLTGGEPTEPSSRETQVRAEGRIACYPGAQVAVASEITGLLVKVFVEEGQCVEKGALIAELKSDELRAAQAEAQARVGELEAELGLAQQDRDRNQQLLDSHTISQQEFDRAQRDVAVIQARRASAEATVTRLQATLAQTRIRAPISGAVVKRHVQPGESIAACASVVTIADLDRIRVEAEVDEYDAALIQVGQTVRITAEGFPGKSWLGRVEEVPSVLVDKGSLPRDPARPVDVRVLLAKIAFTEPPPLKLGQRVEVEIQLDGK